MQMSTAAIAYNKKNEKTIAVQYAKMALQEYTDQGDHVGVLMAGQILKKLVKKVSCA